MARTALVALVVVLVLALPATATGAVPLRPSAPSDSAAGQSDLAILTLDSPVSSGVARQSIDVATTVSIERDAAAASLERYTFDERLQRIDEDERRAFLVEALLGARRHVEDLREREASLRAAYVNRTIDTPTFVRRLARLRARTARFRAYLGQLGTYATDVPGISFQGRLNTIDASLVGLDGPVRDRALSSLYGSAPPVRLHAAASPDGTVLSMIDRGRYVREAYRSDRQTTAPDDRLGVDQAFTRFAAAYPTAFETTQQQAGLAWSIDKRVGGYRIEFRLADGTISAYMDSDTGDVFYEIRDRTLSASAPSTSATANGTLVVVNRTYPGGPLRIVVSDATTGEPVPAAVIVDGERIETGDDGVLWTLAPRSPQFTVTAIAPGGRVTTAVRTLPPQPVVADPADGSTANGTTPTALLAPAPGEG